ncbi:MAG: RHS repeat-associated core domain-containing protein [Pirellulaceae bacterium]
MYDGEGNVVERKDRASNDTRELVYDHRNRLTRITERSAEGVIALDVRYTYDALDRRIAKTVDDDGEGSGVERTTYFVYDGVQVLLEFEDVDGSGTVQQPELTRRYLYGPEIDQVLAQELVQAGETQWLLADHLGSIRDVVDDGGQLVNHIQYDSFGNVLSQSDSANSSRFLYTGREFDSESELYYYRARYYDANIGRFISEDPLGFGGGHINVFSYVGNLPVLYTDPLGLKKKKLSKDEYWRSVKIGALSAIRQSEWINPVGPEDLIVLPVKYDLLFSVGFDLFTHVIGPNLRQGSNPAGPSLILLGPMKRLDLTAKPGPFIHPQFDPANAISDECRRQKTNEILRLKGITPPGETPPQLRP